MSMNILNDISKVYLETIATEAAKPDYLDFDKDGNKKESMKKALKDKKEVAEAVRGQDTEMRKAASAERRAGDTLTKKLPPSKGKQFGQYQSDQISYIDKKTKGKHMPGLAKEALDPVGKEDKDIDNDGDHDKSDKYLLNRRKVRGAAIATRKESFSNWRQDLAEVMDKIEKEEEHKQIKEKKNINNKVVINPDFKEAVEELGGVLLETVEVDEAYKPIDKDKENRMYRRAGNLARTAVSSSGKKKEVAQTKSSKIVSAITRQKEKERFDRIGQSPAHNEEFVSEEGLEEKRGLWDNIHAKRKRGERPAKPGEEGYPKTLNVEENELEEEITSEKGKAKAAEMIAKRTTDSGRAKSGQGASVAAIKHIQRSNRDGLGGTPPNRKVAGSNWPKSYSGIGGTGNKAARRAAALKSEEYIDEAGTMQGGGKDPCWKGYEMVGMKKKGGKEVPNCVPKEEFELDEKTLTPAETKKKEEIVMSMKKKGDFSKYGERAKEVMYATATKQAKKLAEADMPQETQDTDKRAKTQQKQKLLQILQQKERAVRAGMTDISASYELDGEVLDERRREDKGKPRPAEPSAAFKAVSKLMGSSRAGVQPRGQKKVPGRKQPPSGQSPAQRVATRRAAAQTSQSLMHSPRD